MNCRNLLQWREEICRSLPPYDTGQLPPFAAFGPDFISL